SANIEGDHVVAVVWRGRLHLFWVTFMDKPQQGASNGTNPTGDNSQNITDMSFSELHKAVQSSAPPREVDVQLNWAEYFQGQWTTPESSGFGNPVHVSVPNNFDIHTNSRTVFIHTSKEPNAAREGAVKIHLRFPPISYPIPGHLDAPMLPPTYVLDMAFRIVSKNCVPQPVDGSPPDFPPYLINDKELTQPTVFDGSGSLKIQYGEQLDRAFHLSSTDILRQPGKFSLLISGVDL